MKTEWISVNDRLPEANTNVFTTVLFDGLYVASLCVVAQFESKYKWWNKDIDKIHPIEVSHWMPLPSPPIQQQENTNEQL
jgi:hypothetical protein